MGNHNGDKCQYIGDKLFAVCLNEAVDSADALFAFPRG
jgi:hypothetical protein